MALCPIIAAAGASIIGSAISADAAGDAADAQLQQYLQTRADLAPYREGGLQGFEKFRGLVTQGPPSFDEYEKSPDYQSRLQRGIDTLDYSAAAAGRRKSGAHLKDLTRFGQDYAMGDYDNYLQRWMNYTVNPLLQLGTMGQNAANQTGAFGANAAQLAGNYNANAGSILGGGIANAGIGALQDYAYFRGLGRPSSYSTVGQMPGFQSTFRGLE